MDAEQAAPTSNPIQFFGGAEPGTCKDMGMVQFAGALAAFILIWLSGTVYAADTCEAQFRPAVSMVYGSSRVSKLQSRIVGNFGVNISSDSAALGRMGAGFHPQVNRTLLVDNHDPDFIRFINTYHEAVHVNTDHIIRTDPQNPQRVMGINFRSTGILHSSLPDGYENFFSIDEMKAHKKQTLLLEQIVREHPEQVEGINEYANTSAEETEAFKTASQTLLSEVQKFLTHADKPTLKKAFSVRSYAEDAPDVFVIVVSVQSTTGLKTEFTAGFPLKDSSLKNPFIEPERLRGKVLKLCKIALRYTN